MMAIVKTIFGLCVVTVVSAYNENPEERIGTYLKSTIQNISQHEIIRQMELHFLSLRLLVTAQPRKWADPVFAQLENKLIPYDTDRKTLEDLIDQVVENLVKNSYLHEFLLMFKGPGLRKLLQDVDRDGHWG